MPSPNRNTTDVVRITPENKAARFWSRVDIRGADECWPWTGCIGTGGYGHLGRKTWGTAQAHRVAYELHAGAPPPGDLDVCHSCDNPPCCNPGHLWLGTASDNVRDAMRKGRLTPPILPPNKAARGERVARAVITDDIARHIASSPKATGDLAAELGLSKVLIWQVRSGKTWRHATGLSPARIGRDQRKATYRAVEVDGVVYPTIIAAAKQYGLSATGMRDRISAGRPGHRYVPADEFYALSA